MIGYAISVAFPILVLATVWMIVTFTVMPPNEVSTLAGVIGFILLLAGPVVAIGVLFFVSGRIFADKPADCWFEREGSTDD